ncbi:hypothetical protein GQ53DRAFT_848020 [Thozetella sp. PMI_491]|nr:hypothetical protein GQ53DRAFT_848020 [Thozetella sp. PMI_491]
MSEPSEVKRRRRCITNAQRRALRAWFQAPPTPPEAQPKKHADASAWWQQQYGYYLNSSTVSEILSYKYDPLDGEDNSTWVLAGGRKRQRAPKWEALEEELMKWVLGYEMMEGKGSVTGEMLKRWGTQLWLALPCYRGLECPKWSEGWRCRFRARYKNRRQTLFTI